MNCKRIFHLLFIVIISNYPVYSQSIIKPDKDGNISKEVPFDQYLKIELNDLDKSIEKFSVWRKFKVDGVLVDSKKKDFAFIFCKEKWKYRDGGNIQVNTKVDHVGEIANLRVKPLPPNRHFEVVLRKKFRGEALKKMIGVVHQFYLDDYGKKITEPSKKRQDSLGIKAIKKLSLELENPLPDQSLQSALGASWLYGKNYADSLYSFMEKPVDTLKEAINENEYGQYNSTSYHLNQDNYSLAAKSHLQFEKSGKLFSNFNQNFSTDDGREKVYLGLKSLSGATADNHELVSRLKNIDSSIQMLDSLTENLNLIKLHDTAEVITFDNMISETGKVKEAMKKNRDYLEGKIKAISTLLDGEENMRYSTWFSGSNAATNLKTLGSRLIIPTIGLAWIPTDVSGTNFYKPFVGASIHFRQINKELPLRELSSSFLHRSSLLIAVTVSKINDETNEFSDLNSSTSLMLGYNFKLSHAFGISYGGVIMKRADPNPTISKKQTIVNHYIALTFDIDFTSNLNKVGAKFGL